MLGMVIPALIGNPYNGCINMYTPTIGLMTIPETNSKFTPENRPFTGKLIFQTIHFRPKMLVSVVGIWKTCILFVWEWYIGSNCVVVFASWGAHWRGGSNFRRGAWNLLKRMPAQRHFSWQSNFKKKKCFQKHEETHHFLAHTCHDNRLQ